MSLLSGSVSAAVGAPSEDRIANTRHICEGLTFVKFFKELSGATGASGSKEPVKLSALRMTNG